MHREYASSRLAWLRRRKPIVADHCILRMLLNAVDAMRPFMPQVVALQQAGLAGVDTSASQAAPGSGPAVRAGSDRITLFPRRHSFCITAFASQLLHHSFCITALAPQPSVRSHGAASWQRMVPARCCAVAVSTQLMSARPSL
jgi:hypothetical protein